MMGFLLRLRRVLGRGGGLVTVAAPELRRVISGAPVGEALRSDLGVDAAACRAAPPESGADDAGPGVFHWSGFLPAVAVSAGPRGVAWYRPRGAWWPGLVGADAVGVGFDALDETGEPARHVALKPGFGVVGVSGDRGQSDQGGYDHVA